MKIIPNLCKNKIFENRTIDGYTVTAIDGTKFFGSDKKSCLECLANNNHNFHSGVVRARLDIENSILNNLKNECGLEHCFVHGEKAVEAVLCLIFIASNL